MTERDILNLISEDEEMMKVLQTAQKLDLPDWMIGAGFVRNKVWNHLHGLAGNDQAVDIDLIYFNPADLNEGNEKNYDQQLKVLLPANWSTKNQARMHLVNNDTPYLSSADALARWVETATCVAVKLNSDGRLELIAPHGVEDLVNLVVRPSPLFNRDLQIFHDRINKKSWLKKWPKLKVVI